MKIKKLKLDVIHTQTEFSIGWLGKLVSKIFNIPMVHTYHTMYEDYVHYIANGKIVTSEIAKKFSKMFCNRAQVVIAPTEKTFNLLKKYGVKKEIQVVPTGIDMSIFSKDLIKNDISKLKKNLGINKNDFVILFLGRVAKEKSIDFLISSMPNILKIIKNCKLLIVGDGPELNNLKKLAYDLKIDQEVIFVGEIPWSETNLYYKISNVFATASVSETQGLTYIEAIASDLIVIAKKDDSILKIIENFKTGFLFENKKDLIDIINKISDQNFKKEEMIEHAKKNIKDLTSKKFVVNIERIYKNLIKK
jgi:1,2-diacylglycerol 3-alpha-glucosyltransferase